MQTLGLSDSTPRTESRWRALFWPTILNEGDFDYVTTQGFWVCFAVAAVELALSVVKGPLVLGALESLFFFLAGVGVRQRSRVAAIAAFSAYLLSAFVLQRYTGNGFGIIRIVFLALLFANIRGNWVSARWALEQEPSAPVPRLSQTLGDKLSDQLPIVLWPKTRIVFYALAALEIGALLYFLLVPRSRALGDGRSAVAAATSGRATVLPYCVVTGADGADCTEGSWPVSVASIA